jgi:hypothetical protein
MDTTTTPVVVSDTSSGSNAVMAHAGELSTGLKPHARVQRDVRARATLITPRCAVLSASLAQPQRPSLNIRCMRRAMILTRLHFIWTRGQTLMHNAHFILHAQDALGAVHQRSPRLLPE